MERSFKKEVQALKLGDGETFHGEGILAVTKALLQSGVSYVGGYQGAPVSHLLDVLVDAEDIIGDLGVHLETCTNEASAAAMLGASINYPLRGAVTWKSIVGTNVAADALSNLASPGVIGGAMIILGEDYGEGASVIQERSYAYAMKSSMWLLDPRPDLPTIVRMVEEGFELSEASHAPVMMELRIRACHVTGEFKTKDNRRADFSGKNRIAGPPRFEYGRLAHPPVTFSQERLKVEERLPAAQQFIRERKLNEVIPGDLDDVGIIVHRRAHQRRAARAGAARSRRPLRRERASRSTCSTSPIRWCRRSCATSAPASARCWWSRKASPTTSSRQVNVELRRADIQTRVLGKGCLPRAGEYMSEVLLNGLAAFLAEARPAGIDADAIAARAKNMLAHKAPAMAALGDIPPRPPNFCTGCPERPVFTAIKLMQRELGPTHISADIGCHSFATFAPFSLGNSILGYGMSLASAAAVTPNMDRRPIAVMGDGGFWHNGLITGVASNLFNKGDGVLIVMQNGYASATGQQYLPSSAANRIGTPTGMTIEQTLRSLGVKWLRTVRSYSVAKMAKTLKEAMRTAERGLKVIIADGECQLARQRRVRAEDAEKLKRGERVVRVRFGVDDEICTGDHSCIRLSGCPSLTVKPNPDPLRSDPVATVIESCVGCGLCGEVAHAAVLCPSFYRAEIIRNPTWWDRMLHRVRQTVIGWLEAHPPRRGHEARVPAASSAHDERSAGPADHHPDRRARRRRRRRAHRLDRRRGRAAAASRCNRRRFPASRSAPAPPPITSRSCRCRRASLAAGGRCWRWRPASATSISCWRANCMEAGRTIAGGFVTPDRTLMIASTARSYLVVEKMAMGDGRYDSARLIKAIEEHAQAQSPPRHGSAGQAKRRHDQRGHARAHRRLRAAADSRRRRSKARSAPTARRSTPTSRASAPGSRRRTQTNATVGEATPPSAVGSPTPSLADLERAHRRGHAAARPRHHSSKAPGGSPPIRTSPMRGSTSTGWRRSAPPTSARRPAGGCCARSRGISRCACPTRT